MDPITKMGVAHAFEQYVQVTYFNFVNQVGQSVQRLLFTWAATYCLRKAYHVENED